MDNGWTMGLKPHGLGTLQTKFCQQTDEFSIFIQSKMLVEAAIHMPMTDSHIMPK